MRFHLLGLVLLAGVAAPAQAQRTDNVERRIDRLEQELRAVQRRVFPGGRAQFVEPEIRPEDQPRPGMAAVSGDALASLSARVDALEAQLRTLTNQAEENGFRLRQMEAQMGRLHGEIEARVARLEQAAAPQPAATTAAAADRTAASSPAGRTGSAARPAADEPAAQPAVAAAGDSAEEAYNAGFRLWDAGRYDEAQQALEAAATAHANSRWASWARNLQGRAYLDDDKPATAARIFLENYRTNPRGERAADSLYFLGVALTRLNRRPEACRVFDELEQEYPNMREFLRTRLPQARSDARCSATTAQR